MHLNVYPRPRQTTHLPSQRNAASDFCPSLICWEAPVKQHADGTGIPLATHPFIHSICPEICTARIHADDGAIGWARSYNLALPPLFAASSDDGSASSERTSGDVAGFIIDRLISRKPEARESLESFRDHLLIRQSSSQDEPLKVRFNADFIRSQASVWHSSMLALAHIAHIG